jgi:hypothetical protein
MNDTMQTIAERMAELEAEVWRLRAMREELQEEVSRLAGLLATEAERERCAEIERNAALRSTEVVEWQRRATEAEQRGREAERGAVVWHIREEADRQGLQMYEVLTTLADRLKRGAHVGTAAAETTTEPVAEHAGVNPPVSAEASTLAQLRHAYHLGLQGSIGDQRAFVENLVAPAVRVLERLVTQHDSATKPQPAPVALPGRPEVVPLVIADIQQRAVAGLVKYKVPLTPENRRRAKQDRYEELLDAACYAKQDLIEEDEIRALVGASDDESTVTAVRRLVERASGLRACTTAR